MAESVAVSIGAAVESPKVGAFEEASDLPDLGLLVTGLLESELSEFVAFDEEPSPAFAVSDDPWYSALCFEKHVHFLIQ